MQQSSNLVPTALLLAVKSTYSCIRLSRRSQNLALGLALSCLTILSQGALAADVVKADNLDDLNLGTSWTNGTPPTASDVAVWDFTVATAVPQDLSLGADTSWGGIRIVDPAGAVTIFGTNSLGGTNSLTIGGSGVDTSLAVQTLTLDGPVTIGAPQDWNLVTAVTVSGVISGAAENGITLTGSGRLNVSGANDSFVDGVTINAGTLGITTSSLMPIKLNGGTLDLGANIANPVEVQTGGGTIVAPANRELTGPITGSGTATAVIANAGRVMTVYDFSGFAGTFSLGTSLGTLRANVSTFSGSDAMTLDLGTSTGRFLRNNGAAEIHFGALAGGFETDLLGNGANYVIGALNTDSVFSGDIQNCSVVKIGTGTFTLDGTNSFAGGLTISNGIVQVGNFGFSGDAGTGGITNYSALILNRADTFTVLNPISGPGAVTNIGSGKAVLTGANSYTGPTVVTSGTLSIGSDSAATGDITVASSASLGATVTSAGATAMEGNVGFDFGCTYEFDLGVFSNPTAPLASSTGTVTLNGDVTVNVLGSAPVLSVGSITLLEYAARGGSGSFVQGALPADVEGTIIDDTANNRVLLDITNITFVDMTLQYVGDSTGVWDSDNPANQIWRVVGTGQTTNYYSGAAVRFDDSATGTTSIDLTTFVFPESVTVSNSAKTYTFGASGGPFTGAISGSTGLTKRGDGTLIITNANDYTGVTSIEEGVIRVEGENGTLGSGGVTNSGALIIDKTAATNLVPNTTLFSGQITGTGSLTYLGVDKTNSFLEVRVGSEDGNPYSGGTTISNGYVRLVPSPDTNPNGAAAKSTGLGSGTVTFLGDSVLELEDYGNGNSSSRFGNFSSPIHVPDGQTGSLLAAGRMAVSSPVTGNGTFNLEITWVRCDISANFSAFTGQVNVSPSTLTSANDFRVNSAVGWPQAKLHLGVRAGVPGVVMQSITTGGSVIPIGELSADEGATIGFGNNVTWLVGGLNTDATNAASISSANPSFIKEGTGTWTLSGSNIDFTGSMTVSNGVLALATNAVGDVGISNAAIVSIASPGILDVSGRSDGTFPLGTGTNNSQMLGGDGMIQGSLLVGSLGTVAPGFSIGTLTVSDSVTLGGTTVMEVETPNNSDQIVAPAITAGGTLLVTNIGVGLQEGDTFQLFSTGLSGAFALLDLQTNDLVNNVAYTWNTDNLYSLGQISVATATPTVNTTPTNIVFSATGGTLDLEWPESQTGWRLQTNAVGVASASDWFDVPGSTTTNRVILTIDPATSNVFHRLVYP